MPWIKISMGKIISIDIHGDIMLRSYHGYQYLITVQKKDEAFGDYCQRGKEMMR